MFVSLRNYWLLFLVSSNLLEALSEVLPICKILHAESLAPDVGRDLHSMRGERLSSYFQIGKSDDSFLGPLYLTRNHHSARTIQTWPAQ